MIVAAVRALLRPLVRLLIAKGIGLPALMELLKEAYVDVAVAEFPVGEKKQTDSRISLLTGIHRLDVKHLRSEIVSGNDGPPMSVSLGAQIVARAWTDPAYKQRLLDDGRAACAEAGVMLEAERLIAVENTPAVHNVIVCTLCSCYPRSLLGMPPTWYKSRNYRSRVVFEPRTVLREFGTVLPDSVTVRVHDSNADMRYLVVPMRPAGTDGWSIERLAGLISRDMLVGVTVPKLPA